MEETQVVEKKEKIGFGPVVGIIILVLVFALGGAYFFMHEKARLHTPPVQETINA